MTVPLGEMTRAERVHAAVLLLMPLAKDEEWVPVIASLMDRERTILKRLRKLRENYRLESPIES